MDSKAESRMRDTTDDSRTLSRNSLYAPLNAYQSGELQTPPKIPRSCTDGSFVEWIHQMSADYHQSCKPGDPRNTGNRFVSTAEAQEKIMYRTLSLFGKDYGARLGGTARAPVKPDRSVKRRKRKRQSKCSLLIHDPATLKASLEFVTQLNVLWNQYMLKLLATKGCELPAEVNGATLSKVSQVIMECSSVIEWVGAKVRIVVCGAFPHWKGREGILISSTKNTWVLFQIAESSGDGVQLTVPKHDTVIAATLQLQDNKRPLEQGESDGATLQIQLTESTIL